MTTARTMQALQLQEPNQLVMTTLPTPRPGPRDVLVRTVAATICTSDLHDISHNPFGIELPRVLGHEAAGIVVECGSEVTHIETGVLVALHPVITCGDCPECRRGFSHHCLHFGHLGFDRDGCFAEYVIQRADRVRRIPEGIPAHVASLMEPLCVCLQAIARAGELGGKTVLVVGDGPFGILIARLALRSAEKVILVGREEFRLGQVPGAVTLKADSIEITRSAVLEQVAASGVDLAILAVSSNEALELCTSTLRPRGRLVIFSAMGRDVPMDLQKVHLRELEIVGACNDEERLDDAVGLMTDPSLGLSELITHRVPFRDWSDAFELASHHHNRALKVTLTFPTP